MYKMDLALMTQNGWCATKLNQIRPNRITLEYLQSYIGVQANDDY